MNERLRNVASPPPGTHTGKGARTTALACAGLVLGMVAMAYAAVPLYRLFCQATGFGGTPMVGTARSASVSDRTIGVRFDANVSPGIAWRFAPETPEVEVRLGETRTVFYRITNTGRTTTTGIATFNVQPDLAGPFFVKVQCFCFEEKTLAPGESIEAPVVFYVEPALADSFDLKKLRSITLSYTVFPSKAGGPVGPSQARADKPEL